MGPDTRMAAGRLLERVDRRLRELLASDEQDARTLEVRKRRTGAELERVRSTRHAMAAYRAAPSGAVSRFDQVHDES
jgi:hypothetical protein